ncbi:histidine kinase dimerization/phosphoacceptor domain -containing protein [Mucilaginibacter aquariorum]|uniref:histidine kinase n=1 Tax=Mucilaginibacter aquariorum TaxID=2967225 RepID=A0ABT1SXL8_9SPHI|nr:histidine kinase dimerization/phosphoacceptor domain -containing protein [Mucilaginibacter aquariorum]MCQ6957012.1 sensor histidine kinase [Mucilaginibacter aquariorum]
MKSITKLAMKMIRKLLCLIILQTVFLAVYGQDITGNLSVKEAHDLYRSLGKIRDENVRADIFLKLAQYNVMKPGENKIDLDSAAAFIVEAEKSNLKLRDSRVEGYIWLVKSMLTKESGNKKEGKEFVEKSILILNKVSNSPHLGDAYVELASYFNYTVQAELDEKTKIVELAVNALKQEGKTLKLAYSQELLADLYTSNGNQTKALPVLDQALANYQAVHFKMLQGVYIIYSAAYSSNSDYKQGLHYGLLALKTSESLKDSSMQRCQINNIVGVILTKMKEYHKALDYFKNGLKIAQRYNDQGSVLLIVANTVGVYLSLKEYAAALDFMKSIPPKYLKTKDPAFLTLVPWIYCNLYTSLKQPHQAKPYADYLLDMATNHRDLIINKNKVFIVLVRYFTLTRQFSLAYKFLNIGISDLKKNPIEVPIKMKDYYVIWFKLDSASGNYKLAIERLLRYNHIKDSLFDETKNRQLKQIEIDYDLDKKASQIKILNQKTEIQKSGLQKAELMKDLTFGGIIILLIFISLLYRQYRLKQKGNRLVLRSNVLIKQKNQLLEHLLKEKEWLLKEVHHRVKNNLHTVICLLESQAAYLQDDALKAIESSQHRIYAMSLIHQKLYQSEDIKTIDMSVYLPEFIQYLNDSFGTHHLVRFHLEIEPIQLGVSQAIPLALIVNEAVTNSIKYAFAPGFVGIISISMKKYTQDIKLVIADNGVGLDPAITNMPLESLGLKLMNGLSEDINGRIVFENNKGTKIMISFNSDPLDMIQDLSGGINGKK